MVRFSDLLGQGDDNEAAPDATPTEPVPGPPTEPPPPPPPASSGNDLLDRLTSYASRSALDAPAPSPPAPPPAADEGPGAATSERSEADERLVESLRPVDDDLLPKRRSK
jgi:hypothetical protein